MHRLPFENELSVDTRFKEGTDLNFETDCLSDWAGGKKYLV